MDFRYDIGDAVIVRQNLEHKDYYMESGPECGNEYAYFSEEMEEWAGKVVHISDYTFDDQYYIEEDGEEYHWTDEMLMPVGFNFVSLL